MHGRKEFRTFAAEFHQHLFVSHAAIFFAGFSTAHSRAAPLLSATGDSRAQQSGGMADSVPNSHAAVVPREPRGVVGVSVGVNGGYVLPHNKVVANLLTGSRYVTIAHACATWRADAARAAEDDNMYGIPRFESGLLISDFSLVPLHRQEGSTLIPSASPLFLRHPPWDR